MSQIVDVTLADFESVVLEGSKQRPVVLYFWTTWCASCKAMQPVLEKLATDLDFVLAKVNAETPENQQLAAYFRIASVPDIRVIQNGQMADVIQGALPENQLRQRLSRFFLSEEDQLLMAAEEAVDQGLANEALSILVELGTRQPQNPKVRYLHAKALVLLGRHADAQALLGSFTEADDFYREARSLLELMDFHQEVARTDSVDASGQTYREGCRLAVQGDYRGALELFLVLVQESPASADLPARKAMLTLFGVMGPKHELTWEFRSRLNTILFV